jgi:hypothetical protein
MHGDWKRQVCRIRGILLISGIVWIGVTPEGSTQEREEISSDLWRRSISSQGMEMNAQRSKGAPSDEESARPLVDSARQLLPVNGSAKGFAVASEPSATGTSPPTPATSTGSAEGAATENNTSGFQCFPGSVLFQPPIANPDEPRFFAKPTNVRNNQEKNIFGLDAIHNVADTGIGGVIPFLRYSNSGKERDAWQLDVFAVVFNRWSDYRDSIAVDYRVGIPLTRAIGPWEFKIAYEHTSTHLGDEFEALTGRQPHSHLRDEVVLGVAYRFLNAFRVYGIAAYAANLHTEGPSEPFRFDVGLEWSSPCATPWYGRPYAAADIEIRGDLNYATNLASQLGWEWRGHAYGPSFRVGVEYFSGRSPYGQFAQDREQWLGMGIFFGF